MQKIKAGGDMRKKREATRQQKLFVDEYLRNRKSNAKEAAIAAGYSKKTAGVQASQLLNNPYVLEYLNEREKTIEQELREEFIFDAIEARKVLYDIMKDPESRDMDRINAAKDFLDRAGFKPTDKVDVSGSLDTGLNKLDFILEQLKE